MAADVAQGFAPVSTSITTPSCSIASWVYCTWATEDTVADVGGALAPSLTDVQAYRSMREAFGIQGAWVTNGLDTARYSAEDFDRLSALLSRQLVFRVPATLFLVRPCASGETQSTR